MDIEEYRRLARIEDFHWWYLSTRNLFLSRIKNFFEIRKGQTFLKRSDLKILDAGCGTGGFTEKLAMFGSTVGIDISWLALNLKKHRQAKYINSSVNKMPFKDSFFNLVVCVSVLYHRNVDDQQAMKEIARVLKPGGVVIILLPAFKSLIGIHDLAVHTKKRYSLNEANKLVLNSGMETIEIRYVFSFLFPLFILKRLGEKINIIPKKISDLFELPGWLNNLVKLFCELEWKIADYISLPFGSSLMIIAKKNHENA